MKTPIRVIRRENYEVERYHNTWFANFLEYLSNDFDITYVNCADGKAYIQDVFYEEKEYHISDVDMILENRLNGEVCAISFTEYFNSYIVHIVKNYRFKSMILAHFNYHHLYYWLKKDAVDNKIDKVKPWIFPVYNQFDVNKYRQIRDTSEKTKSLFFKGSGLDSYRLSVDILRQRGIIDTEVYELGNYLSMMSKSRIALGYYQDLDKYVTPFDYPGEFCYRDMEYVAIGVPFIRIEYRDSVYNGLYPNHHYISITREKAYSAFEKNGNEGVADLIQQKYEEVKDDTLFLDFISNNQRNYYDEYVRWPKSAELAYKQLGLKDWISDERD